MNSVIGILIIVLFTPNIFALPQEAVDQNAEPKAEKFTAAAINSEIALLSGFLTLFQNMMTNFWSSVPQFVNLFASPTGAAVPSAAGASPAAAAMPDVPGLEALNSLNLPQNIIPKNVFDVKKQIDSPEIPEDVEIVQSTKLKFPWFVQRKTVWSCNRKNA